MQNEAIRETRNALEESRDQYADLYEFAPVGYLTLSNAAVILEANLTGAMILGVDRQSLINARFRKFIAGEDADQWNRYFIAALRSGGKQVGELRCRKGDGSVIHARFESIRKDQGNGQQAVRMAVSDVTDRVRAEDSLSRKSHDLDELGRAYRTIAEGQQNLVASEAELRKALAEKEALLSEVHHRVKNNLAAFISLLSMDDSYEKDGSSLALRRELQNRARSMALIHEILYNTGKFSAVDMDMYLSSLVDKISESCLQKIPVQTIVRAGGVSLDLGRATTAGLIVNELVTNSFRYAFPPGFDCMAARGEPCTIRISLTLENGEGLLEVSDNGCGLPPGLDPLAAQSFGLKMVNFLARHQLRADVAVPEVRGTGFVFRLHNKEEEV
jgi:PAS domain S-box-containing protein